MRITTLLFLGILFFSSCKRDDAISEKQASHFIKFIGNSGADVGNEAESTSDGGYILVGTVQTSKKGNDILLTKLNKYGNQQWQRTFGDSLNDEGNSIALTSDGGFIITGSIGINDSVQQVALFKIDAFGNQQWENKYGSLIEKSQGMSVEQTADGGYIIGCNTTEDVTIANPNPGVYDILLIKTDALGDTTWTRGYGSFEEDVVSEVKEKQIGGYVILGTSKTPPADAKGGSDIFMISVNNLGGIIDQTAFGGALNDFGESIKVLPNEEYIICGTSEIVGGKNNVVAMKIGTAAIGGGINRTPVFSLSHSSSLGNGNQHGKAISSTTDGGFVLAGDVETSSSGFDQLLMKINSSGAVVWEKSFEGGQDDSNMDVKQTSDNGYIATGYSAFGLNSIITVTKVNSEGELE